MGELESRNFVGEVPEQGSRKDFNQTKGVLLSDRHGSIVTIVGRTEGAFMVKRSQPISRKTLRRGAWEGIPGDPS